jgi:methionine-rich copper-binding protein CopC
VTSATTPGADGSGRSRASVRRRAGAIGVRAAALVVATVSWAASRSREPLQAVSVTPADAASLTAVPAEVSVALRGVERPTSFHLTVAAERDGVSAAVGPPSLAGQVLRVPISIERPGRYLVGYHVALDDGRELAGVSSFEVAGGTGPLPVPPAVPVRVSPSTDAVAAHQHGSVDPLNAALVVFDLALIGLLLSVLLPVLLSVLLRRPSGRSTRTAASRSPTE